MPSFDNVYDRRRFFWKLEQVMFQIKLEVINTMSKENIVVYYSYIVVHIAISDVFSGM